MIGSLSKVAFNCFVRVQDYHVLSMQEYARICKIL